VHGDARVPNLVLRGRSFLWIDLRESAADTLATAQRSDARALAVSALRWPRVLSPELHAPILVALNDVPAGSVAAYDSVANAVWAALALRRAAREPPAADAELDD